MIDLDHNATTRPTPGVVDAVRRALEEFWHNPSSVHRAGQAARREVELARLAVAELIGAKAREIIFTSSATESIQLAIRGVIDAADPRAGPPRLITTRVEHPAVRAIADALAATGRCVVDDAPVLASGIVDTRALASLLERPATLVSVQWANNETGVVQPVRDIADLCREHAVTLHVDAAQWVGREPTPSPVGDLMSFCAHKFHGPKGVGMLWARPGVRLRPQIVGTHELGRRAGTENVPGIAGAGVAAREAGAFLADPGARARLGALRDRLEALVLAAVPDAVVNPAPGTPRLWNTSSIAFPRLEAEALLRLLSEHGVNASAGAACSSGSLDPSPVLLAMGIPPILAHGTIRFSLSRETTQPEVDQAAAIVARCVQRLRASLPASASAP